MYQTSLRIDIRKRKKRRRAPLGTIFVCQRCLPLPSCSTPTGRPLTMTMCADFISADDGMDGSFSGHDVKVEPWSINDFLLLRSKRKHELACSTQFFSFASWMFWQVSFCYPKKYPCHERVLCLVGCSYAQPSVTQASCLNFERPSLIWTKEESICRGARTHTCKSHLL